MAEISCTKQSRQQEKGEENAGGAHYITKFPLASDETTGADKLPGQYLSLYEAEAD